MAQVDSENSTAMPGESPAQLSRRTVLAGVASAAALPIVAATPAIPAARTTVGPIFAAIDAFRRADAAMVAWNGDITDEVANPYYEAYSVVLRTRPVTPAELVALTGWVRERADWLLANSSHLPGEELCAIAAAIDDATRGMSGLEPWSPPPSAAAHNAQALDAELIELGARFEPPSG